MNVRPLAPADFDTAALGALPLVPVDPAVLGPGPAPIAVLTPDVRAGDTADLIVTWSLGAASACGRCPDCHARIVGDGAVCVVAADRE